MLFYTEEKHDLLKVIKPEKIVSVNIKEEESTPEEWKNRALELIDKGNIEQAENTAEKLLHKGEKEYAEEIINTLKAKGYHVQAQSSDKDKLANSELKTETSQEFSTSESRTPKSKEIQGKKRKQHPKEKKKLENNTEKLFSALKNGDWQRAEVLIMQGVNSKANTKSHY